MTLSLIVARSRNDVIGKNNQMPWYLPADLKHFKQLTMGKPIIMGRKTFESIGRPLLGRRNIVISRQKTLLIDGCEVFASIDMALAAVSDAPETMIIGGANLYAQVLDRVNCIYMTVIDSEFEGDSFFPALDKKKWQLDQEEKHEPDGVNKHGYCFQVWRAI